MHLDRIKEAAAEVVSDDELEALLKRIDDGQTVRAYVGFEPSGTAHVGWMVCADMIGRLVDAGFEVTILLADWHARINDKLGGDLHAIRRCGEYMTDVFEALGVSKDKVTYRFAQEFAEDDDYWALVLQVAKHTTLARMRRAMDILGRSEEEGDADVSKFFYPAMQVADIFHMGIELAYGGLDQRHAHMLARDVAKKLGKTAPVAVHTPLVPNLKGGVGRMDPAEATVRSGKPDGGAPKAASAVETKMSKSDPSTGVFLHDTTDEVAAKIKKAHCPGGETEDNPVLDLLRLVIVPRLADGFHIDRPEKFGGPLEYHDYNEVEKAFVAGDLHPADLKNGVAAALNILLDPVRDYFEKHPENLEFVKTLTTTR